MSAERVWKNGIPINWQLSRQRVSPLVNTHGPGTECGLREGGGNRTTAFSEAHGGPLLKMANYVATALEDIHLPTYHAC